MAGIQDVELTDLGSADTLTPNALVYDLQRQGEWTVRSKVEDGRNLYTEYKS